MPSGIRLGVIALAVLALVPLVLVAQYRSMRKSEPRIHPIQDMDFQPKYKAQTASPLFADGRSSRLPVSGTVAQGQLRDDEHFYEGKVDGEWAVEFPEQISINRATALRGQQRYEIYCATCHGLSGGGDGMTALPFDPKAFDDGASFAMDPDPKATSERYFDPPCEPPDDCMGRSGWCLDEKGCPFCSYARDFWEAACS